MRESTGSDSWTAGEQVTIDGTRINIRVHIIRVPMGR